MILRKKPRLLVTGLCADAINTNRRIRDAVVEGAVVSELFDQVVGASIEVVLAYGRLEFDLVLAAGSAASDTLSFELLQKRCKASGAQLIFWTHEDPYEFDLNRRITDIPDYYFTNERATLPYYNSDKVTWLPLAADTKFLRPTRALRDRSIDLFFCGYGYPIRMHILQRIAAALKGDFIFSLFGPNLQECLPGLANECRLSPKEMAETATRSILTLNLGRDLGIANSQFNIIAETPGPRTFDIALAGAPQILFNDGVALNQFYEPDREILLFDNTDDIVQNILRLQSDEDALLSMAEGAKRRTLDNHLYRHRIDKIMRVVSDVAS